MSGLLRWHRATQEDRGGLAVFTCTEPPRRRKVPPYGFEHDAEWELVVQRYIRGERPPVSPPRKAWVGYDGEELAAFAALEEEGSPAHVFLQLMAVALPYRHQGGGYADEMMEFVLDEIQSAGVELGYNVVGVTAHIHRDNMASQSLARRWKFRHTTWFDDDHQVWASNIVLPRSEEFLEPDGAPHDAHA